MSDLGTKSRVSDESSRYGRLESWKDIAGYLKRDVRTVQRWERLDGLPVYRHPGRRFSAVFAYRSDLDAWRRGVRTNAAPIVGGSRSPWRRVLLASAAVPILSSISLWVARELAGPASPTVSRVWEGTDVDLLGALSPDGRYLSYVDSETEDLAVRELDTGTTRRLTQKGAVPASREFAQSSVFSRDSRQIAYAWSAADETFELHIAPLDGSGSRMVYRDPKWRSMRPVGWTGSGHEIVCLLESHDVGTQIAFVAVGTGRLRVVTTLLFGAPHGVSLSPDDRTIVYDAPVDRKNPAHDIFAITSDGAREVRVASHAGNDVTPIWAPDGTTVVFVSDRGGPTGIWAVNLVGLSASEPRLVKSGVPVTSVVGFAPDGVLYYRTETSKTDVYTAALDPQTGSVTSVAIRGRLAGRSIASDWSPDGRSLVYLSQRNANDPKRVLTVLTVATGEQHEFTLPARNAWSPRWSPDGRSILFAALTKAPAAALYLLDMETGNTTQILEREQPVGGFGPAWAPDGRSVVLTLVEGQRHSIVRFDLASRRTDVIHRPNSPESVGDASVSPDGRVVAFRATSSDAQDATSSLKLVSLAGGTGGELIRFTMPETVSGPVWTADGRHLMFVKSRLQMPDRRELWIIDVSTGDMRSTGISAEGLRCVRVHPGGRQVSFSAGGPQAEVWAIRHVRWPQR